MSYLIKFSAESDARDKQKNAGKTMLIKVLDGFSALITDNFKEAAIRLANIQIVDDKSIYNLCTP